MRHALTVDVEEWFHATSLEPVVGPRAVDTWPSRVDGPTRRLLDLFDRAGAKATFFVLGCIAERHPTLVREIAERGHEVATHGYGHTLITRLSPEAFRKELSRAVRACQDAAGCKVLGHRAPTCSLTEQVEWAFDVLLEEGLEYDSSLRRGPGDMSKPYWIARAGGSRIREFPMTFLRFRRWTLPVASGGYFRLYPYAVTRGLLRRFEARGVPANVCVHPWELDVEHPRMKGLPRLSGFRHYVNLHTVEPKLEQLLRDFAFTTMRETLQLRAI